MVFVSVNVDHFHLRSRENVSSFTILGFIVSGLEGLNRWSSILLLLLDCYLLRINFAQELKDDMAQFCPNVEEDLFNLFVISCIRVLIGNLIFL